MKPFVLSILAVLSLSLVACGGGGGGGGPVPVVNPSQPPTKTVAMRAGFAQVPHTSTKGIARVMAVNVKPQDINLGSAILPSADFIVADKYITTAPGTVIQSQIVAYLTTTDGTTNGITPSTIGNANVQFTITGDSHGMSLASPQPAPTAVPSTMPSNGGVLLAASSLSAPNTVGQTFFQTSANVNGTQQTSQNTANAYSGMCLIEANGTDPNAGGNQYANYGCLTAATFLNGTDSYAGPNPVDISLSQDPTSGNTIVNVPYGGVIIDTTADQVTQVPTIPTGSATSFIVTGSTPQNGTLNEGSTLVFKTHDGGYAKYNPTVFQNYGSGTSAGQPYLTYGMYLAATGTTFAY